MLGIAYSTNHDLCALTVCGNFFKDPIGNIWQKQTDFNYARDLVKFIRNHYGEYFVIAVAGTFSLFSRTEF